MKTSLYKFWLVLLALMFVVSLLILSNFISGRNYFAYLDIGSDSYKQFVPYAMYIARALPQEGFTGWSFQVGLGGPTSALTGDLFSLFWKFVAVDKIPQLRIYLYLLKIVAGGSFFYFFVVHFVHRKEAAVITAFAYSFCGFAITNGQWDSEATSLMTYPLVLWAIVRQVQYNHGILLPLAIAAALFFGTFFVSLGVFLLFVGFVFVICDESPRSICRQWVVKILPLSLLGYLIATPYLLPVVLQLLDSSRVTGGQSLIQSIISKSWAISDVPLIAAEIGGIFHKDLFGVGNDYRGHFNYLEGPSFYFGILMFILIPQLWIKSKHDKKLVIVAAAAFVAYIIFPIFRFVAMGFAAPYFRVSTLWVSMMGLTLAAHAMDQIFEDGVNRRLLLAGVALCIGLLLLTWLGSPPESIWQHHLYLILGLITLSWGVLAIASQGWVTASRLPMVLLLVAVLEVTLVARPSFVHNRVMVNPGFNGYADRTMDALREIRNLDPGIFRIEKDYHSVSLADAMAQDYMGVKSYSLHSRGMVDFHIGAGLLPESSPVINYSNWLSNAGDRFVLNSFLGVKYYVTINPITWPGFIEIPNKSGLHIYRNEFALPFGMVHSHQITREKLNSAKKDSPPNANNLVDVALFNAAVVEQTVEGHGETLDIDRLSKLSSFSLEDLYFSKAKELQDHGLQVEAFASNHIVGQIHPSSAGILVFSIPFSSGWHLLVDGVETPLFRVDYGLLGAAVSGGPHRIDLSFRIPGLYAGIVLGSIGILILLGLAYQEWRKRSSTYGSAAREDM